MASPPTLPRDLAQGVEPSAAPAAEAATAPAVCLNCAAPLGSIKPRYCPACGQETRLKPPTVAEFLQQLGGAYFSTEGALWRTLKLLLFKPGELTRQYLKGRRKHYVLPLRLYLTISLVVLLLLRGLTLLGDPVDRHHENTPAVKLPNNMNFTLWGQTRAGFKDGVFFCQNLPERVCHRLERRVHTDPQAVMTEWERLRERFVGNLGLTLFFMLPVLALGMKAVYFRRRLRYTEHLVFALHLQAFWFLALALLLFKSNALNAAVTLGLPLYTLVAMRRVFGGRVWPLLLRAAVVAALYGFVLLFTLLGAAVLAFLS